MASKGASCHLPRRYARRLKPAASTRRGGCMSLAAAWRGGAAAAGKPARWRPSRAAAKKYGRELARLPKAALQVSATGNARGGVASASSC